MPRHEERRELGYGADQLFNLVADVSKYPEFLPWCLATRIRSQNKTEMIADMRIGFNVFKETFTSRVSLHHPKRISVVYENGPFSYLENKWEFLEINNGCIIDFYVDFEFKSDLMEKAIGKVFQKAVYKMVSAFEKRALALYGS